MVGNLDLKGGGLPEFCQKKGFFVFFKIRNFNHLSLYCEAFWASFCDILEETGHFSATGMTL